MRGLSLVPYLTTTPSLPGTHGMVSPAIIVLVAYIFRAVPSPSGNFTLSTSETIVACRALFSTWNLGNTSTIRRPPPWCFPLPLPCAYTLETRVRFDVAYQLTRFCCPVSLCILSLSTLPPNHPTLDGRSAEHFLRSL